MVTVDAADQGLIICSMSEVTPASLETLCQMARALHRQVVADECEEAAELGFTPHLALLPGGDEEPNGQLAVIWAILESLSDGRARLLRRMRELGRMVAVDGAGQAPPRSALKARIRDLVQVIDPEARAANESLKERLQAMEQEAEHRQRLVEKLIGKAFDQGELIGHLQARLDRINAITLADSAAGLSALPDSMPPDDFLVISPEGEETDGDDAERELGP